MFRSFEDKFHRISGRDYANKDRSRSPPRRDNNRQNHNSRSHRDSRVERGGSSRNHHSRKGIFVFDKQKERFEEEEWYHDRFDLLERTPSPTDKSRAKNRQDSKKNWPFSSYN